MVIHQQYKGLLFRILLPLTQRQRLSKTCFRGSSVRAAGNFRLWDSFESLMADNKVLALFLGQLAETVADLDHRDLVTESFTLEYGTHVGWASTMSMTALPADSKVQGFSLNKRGKGLKVMDPTVLAPLTTELTFIVSIQLETIRGKRRWLVFVQSVYPGSDIGELRGNVSDREGVVFFDFGTPGGDFPEHSAYYKRRVRVLPRFQEVLSAVDADLQQKVRERLDLLCRAGADYPSMKTHPVRENDYWPNGTMQIRINGQWRLMWRLNREDDIFEVVDLVKKGDKRLPYGESQIH